MNKSLYAPVKADKEEATRLVIKCPVELRDAFKAHCAKHNLDMSVLIRRFMEQEVQAANAMFGEQK